MAHPKKLLADLGIAARKRHSQNFLTSPHWAQQLVTRITQGPAPDEYWEIGPGLGALTERLVAHALAPIRVFEIDTALAAYLKNQFPNVDVIEGDFMKSSLPLSQTKRVAILSNMPYHISSPLLFRFIEMGTQVMRMVLTFQKEFGDRLMATASSKNYGSLSVAAQTCFDLESIGTVTAGSFFPAPTVSSAAVYFKPKPQGLSHFKTVEAVTRAAFAHRRKKLTSNLKEAFKKAPVTDLLKNLQIPEDARPENLTPTQFEMLALAMAPYL